MDFLGYLLNITVRPLVLFTVAAAAMWILRARSAAARHAVWTVVVGGMLLTSVFAPLLPELPLRVLQPAPAPVALAEPAAAVAPVAGAPAGQAATRAPRVRVDAQIAAVVIYVAGVLFFLVRLAFGYLFTRRLVRASRPIDRPWAVDTFESAWISVPLTVGWLHPKILLPGGWETWPQPKLEAVLAHERTHIGRADWAISVMAGLTRSVFWFHPLAWWLERRLALLAEQACDDAALELVGTEPYAEALLDMAAAVKTTQGRLVWEAMAMAKASEVKKRIERILDETRQIPKAFTRLRWTALVTCSLPLIYVVSAIRPAPVQAAPQQYPEAAALEQQLAANPHNLELREQLILGYAAKNIREPRMAHILWLIANHPESDVAAKMSLGLSRSSATNDPADYERAASLWKQQAELHPNHAHVQTNAALFFSQTGGDYEEAARRLTAVRAMEPDGMAPISLLSSLYARAVLSTSGDPLFYDVANTAFGLRVKNELENSTDTVLKARTATTVRNIVRALNPDEHPLVRPVLEWADRLAPNPPAGGTMGQVIINGSRLTAPAPMGTLVPAGQPGPPPIERTNPEYPPLARQARISGTVHLVVSVGPDGHPQKIEVLAGHPLLVPAAMEAVRKWVWSPSAAGTFGVEVPFQLDGAASPPPQTASTGEPPAIIKIGGPVQASKLQNRVDPVYPPLAQQARIQGVVQLACVIGEDGKVKNLSVVSGHPLLVPAALEAVKQWVYYPTLLNGQPVQVSTTVEVPFTLP